jgi:hypothetical protein
MFSGTLVHTSNPQHRRQTSASISDTMWMLSTFKAGHVQRELKAAPLHATKALGREEV